VLIWVLRPDGRIDAARAPLSKDGLAALVRSTWDLGPSPPRRGQDPSRAPASPEEIGKISAPSREAWRRLYDVLVAPIRQYLPARQGARLTIIPHGPLLRLSFAALLDDRGVYLTERYVIHYAPAGAALRFAGEGARERAGRPITYLFVADPTPLPKPPGTPLAPLPGTAREARAIAAALPPAQVTMLTGARATEAAVLAALAGTTVVHFATHALINDAEPLDSFLALGGSSPDPASDGRLTVAELYGVTLDADLVVLAACQTAGGRVSGDGIAGFSRALFYAGTPSVLATIWEVADEPSRLLMQEFYRQWHGRSKDEALRLAELRLLRDLRAGRITVATPAGRARLPEHPFFWAGFVLLGEP
jgi:CHAT domain-containing protein